MALNDLLRLSLVCLAVALLALIAYLVPAHAQSGFCMPLGGGPGSSTLCNDGNGGLTTITPMGHGTTQIYQDAPRGSRNRSTSPSAAPSLYRAPSYDAESSSKQSTADRWAREEAELDEDAAFWDRYVRDLDNGR